MVKRNKVKKNGLSFTSVQIESTDGYLVSLIMVMEIGSCIKGSKLGSGGEAGRPGVWNSKIGLL